MSAVHNFKPNDWEDYGLLGKNRFQLTQKGLKAVNDPPKKPDYMLRAIVLVTGAVSIYQAIHIFLQHHS